MSNSTFCANMWNCAQIKASSQNYAKNENVGLRGYQIPHFCKIVLLLLAKCRIARKSSSAYLAKCGIVLNEDVGLHGFHIPHVV